MSSIPDISSSSNRAVKFFKDCWNSSPPQVTSYLTYSTCPDNPVTYTSPNCGLGWRFQLTESYQCVLAGSGSLSSQLTKQLDVTFQPHMCSSMRLSTVMVDLKLSYPSCDESLTHEKRLDGVSVHSNQLIGSFKEPSKYRGRVNIEITLTFNDSDGLSFPTTPTANTTEALRNSLDTASFIDSKFYLFSSRIKGRPGPARPRAVFARSELLKDSSSYMRDLLSSHVSSTPCNLRDEIQTEINKLDAGAFDYDDDSDLDDDDRDEGDDRPMNASTAKQNGPQPSSVKASVFDNEPTSKHTKSNSYYHDGRAFAINGIAYKTWKAFIFYIYTNDIHFNKLKSLKSSVSEETNDLMKSNHVGCSPKSMYRLADRANHPRLKTLARAAIANSLSQSNIITELFSVFTSRYEEIIELEVDFLLKNFTEDVANEFDDMLQDMVSGSLPHCFRVLAFTLRRLRGGSTRNAWAALTRQRTVAGKKKTRETATIATARKTNAGVAVGKEVGEDEEEEAKAQAEKEAAEKAAQESPNLGFAVPKKGKKGKAIKSSPLDTWGAKEDQATKAEEERGEGSASNSISNFGGGGGWGSPSGGGEYKGGSGGSGWGFGSWGSMANAAKSKAPSVKKSFGTWGSGSGFGNSFGNFNFGDSQLSLEKLKLTDVGAQQSNNTDSLFDDWNTVPAAIDFSSMLTAPGASETTEDSKGLPPVPNNQAAASPAPVPVPPAAIEPAPENAVEHTEKTTPSDDAAAADPATDPTTPAGAKVTALGTSADEWGLPVKVKKKTKGKGADDAEGESTGRKKKGKKGKK
ncbi:hypothetical protein AN958_01899 [Leucoagaricus sp. SymC.cos]|nr:hypothetical protein AN958_01899 [Leucoagaricus sp. SymC.cos]